MFVIFGQQMYTFSFFISYLCFYENSFYRLEFDTVCRGMATADGMVRRDSPCKAEGEPYENHIIMCEHPHVYTLGRSGKENNMLLSEEQLKAIDASFTILTGGGDITYHGPGQLVCYPILNLEEFRLGLKEYVHLLEEAVIRVCASYGIEAGRLEKATGVWLEGNRLVPVRFAR